MQQVKGYKAFNKDWTCRGKQYRVGELFEENCGVVIKQSGMHFSRKVANCFREYPFDESKTRIAEVLAIGDILEAGGLCATNKLVILRELTWAEVNEFVNTGAWNTGFGSTGQYNSGNYNSGHLNFGNFNSGNFNIGNRNSGDWNSGKYNSGCYNTGLENSGNHNSGNRNSGDWNTTNHSSGCFNTVEKTIKLFNKKSKWTMKDWESSAAKRIMDKCPFSSPHWIDSEDMTEEEKALYKNHQNERGCLGIDKITDKCVQKWWDNLKEEERECVKSLPNFDKTIFRECTGIEV